MPNDSARGVLWASPYSQDLRERMLAAVDSGRELTLCVMALHGLGMVGTAFVASFAGVPLASFLHVMCVSVSRSSG